MRYRPIVVRIFCLIGLAASGAGVAEQIFASGDFCEFGGGCEQIAASPYARPLGIPLPAVGAAGFGLVLVLSLFPNTSSAGLLRPLAFAAGATGAALLLVQILVIGRTCSVCIAADLSGIGLAATAGVGRFRGAYDDPSWPWRAAWLITATLAISAPTFWEWAGLEPPPPAQVSALWVADRINVVEVTDFDCPHCQRADGILKEVLGENGDVHFVRLVAPMPKHRNARPAGLAYLAAAGQGQGEAMADALFATADRSPAGCRRLAEVLHLDLSRYDRALDDPEANRVLDATAAWAKGAGPGVPLTWVQDHLIPGVPAPDELRAAIRRARRDPH